MAPPKVFDRLRLGSLKSNDDLSSRRFVKSWYNVGFILIWLTWLKGQSNIFISVESCLLLFFLTQILLFVFLFETVLNVDVFIVRAFLQQAFSLHWKMCPRKKPIPIHMLILKKCLQNAGTSALLCHCWSMSWPASKRKTSIVWKSYRHVADFDKKDPDWSWLI